MTCRISSVEMVIFPVISNKPMLIPNERPITAKNDNVSNTILLGLKKIPLLFCVHK
jgi:hypothetical protein